MTTKIDKFNNLAGAFFDIAEKSPHEIIYFQLSTEEEPIGLRKKIPKTYLEVSERVKKIALYLKSIGIRKGDKVAILSSTRGEWLEIDLAILSVGAVVISVYQSLQANDIAYILFDSDAKIVFAENKEQVDKLVKIQNSETQIPGHEDRPSQTAKVNIDKIISIEPSSGDSISDLNSIFNTITSTELFTLEDITHKDLASLVYTSGTSGPPKGVMQTHLNHLSNIRQAYEAGIVKENNTLILFLPLAHSFAKLMGYIGFLTPVKIYFPAIINRESSKIDPISILRDIKEVQAEIVPIVPRFLEKMKEGVETLAKKKGLSNILLELSIKSAKNVFNKQADFVDNLIFFLTSAIRRRVKNKLFGNDFLCAISGGAKLTIDVGVFFNSLGITVFEGYGLTETCVATNVNTIKNNRIGTVGKVLTEDIEMKISEDSEILFRGPNITLGYYKRPTATKASWDEEGWFHTGDLGEVDDGFLKIIGRKKEIIVTSGGKKISPQPIEEKIKGINLVSEAIVVGDNQPFCVALIVLNDQQKTSSEIEANIKEEINKINETLASFETVKNFLILKESFTIENGLLTPTFKVKRKAVETKYQKEIEDLYKLTKR